MWTKLTVVGCLLLTAVVVHTALRIELANHRLGTFLPRAEGLVGERWHVPDFNNVMEFAHYQLAKQRSNRFAKEHPGEEIPPLEEFIGEPSSKKEADFLNRRQSDYATLKELHWWVYGFGAFQYGLAPLALVWSAGNLVALKKRNIRLLSTCCVSLAFGAIFLMVLRGY